MNPWTVTGSVPFLSRFSESPSASLGGLLSFWVQEEPPSLRTEREGDQEFPWLEHGSLGLSKFAGRAPEPPHRAGGRSGVSLAFYTTLVHPFRSEGGVVCRALECEPGSLGLDKVAGRAPEPLHGARGRSGVPLAFCATLAHPFRSKGGVVCRALECEPGSLGLSKVAGRAP